MSTVSLIECSLELLQWPSPNLHQKLSFCEYMVQELIMPTSTSAYLCASSSFINCVDSECLNNGHCSPPKDTPLQQVLELACQKWKIPRPYDQYAFLLVLSTTPPGSHAGKISATIVAPLDKTVATLPQALAGLVLVPRNRVESLGKGLHLTLTNITQWSLI